MRLHSGARTGKFALVWLASLAWLLGGCSHYVQRGEALYREHRYVEAAEAFERTEARLSGSSAVERAQYGLYRGLTFLYLDDSAGARTWLGYAFSVVQKAPGTLHQEEQTLLGHAFAELDQRTRRAGVIRPVEAQVAHAGAVPAPHSTRAPANGNRAVLGE